jgi:hypothetical protein
VAAAGAAPSLFTEALNFDGLTQYAEDAALASAWPTTGFTLAMWIKWDGNLTDFFFDADGLVMLSVNNSSVVNVAVSGSNKAHTTTLTPSVWYFVCVTHAAGSAAADLWVDTVKVTGLSSSYPAPSLLYFGARQSNPGFPFPFAGRIARAWLTAGVQSDETIQGWAGDPQVALTVDHEWPFGDASDGPLPTLIDAGTAADYTLTAVNGPTFVTDYPTAP